jgi:purine-nucleoside/S-methyl-5'-thioadenosine phosphorylase / adenosine deaminase
MAFQVHGARVAEADPRGVVRAVGTDFEPCDGLWTDRRGQAMLLVTADCLPVVLAGAGRLAVLHVGWRGLLAGVVEAGAAAVGRNGFRAAVGPGIGPCCYEVGEDVAEPFRERFGADVATGGTLDLRLAAERALHEAGCAAVDRVDACTACDAERFFSHRRDRGHTGRQGVVAVLA